MRGMVVIVIIISVIVLIGVFLYLIMVLISYKVHYKSKVSQFERGFVKSGSSSPVVSIHFFMLVFMFIIFDFEIVLFIGLVTHSIQRMLSVFILYLFMLSGLYLEW